MAIIIPTATSTFGDSTKTEGKGRTSKYVLAQFRADADFVWVARTRSILVKDELKFRDLKEARPRLRQNGVLWTQIEHGVGQASIIVVSPDDVAKVIMDTLSQEEIERAGGHEKALIEAVATELVSTTPIAYLPNELVRAIPWSPKELTNLDAFTPEGLRKALGGGLKQAVIFTARAHATFDVGAMDGAVHVLEAFRSPRVARIVLPEVLSTARVFDSESPASVRVLNDAVDQIAATLEERLPTIGEFSSEPLIREADSRAFDEIQACDIAAGWAREVLETSPPRALGQLFERVWLNGQKIK